MFAHGSTFAGHPVAAATAMANLDIFEREDLCGHVLEKEPEFRAALESLYDIPIVGDVRGDPGALSRLLSPSLPHDRGYPVVQLAPPLIADTEQFEEIVDVLRPVLEEAARRVGH